MIKVFQLEAKIEDRTKQMHRLEDQILEINKTIANLTECRNKLLEQKSDIWWQIENIKEDIALLKEVADGSQTNI